jgi:ABC-type multidrug transport system ATPase subunit
MIEINNLTKRFDSNYIFDNTSFVLPSNGLFLLTGANGLGKTTLLNILSLTDTDFEGKFLYNGVVLNKKNADIYRGKDCYTIYQDFIYFDDVSVYQNIDKLSNSKLSKDEVFAILKRVGIERLIDHDVDSLSSGEKRRLTIAMSLIFQPKVLLCDEIVASLDEANVSNIIIILKEISKTSLVVLVSHNNLDKYKDLFDGNIKISDKKIAINSKKECVENNEINKKQHYSFFKFFKNVNYKHRFFTLFTFILSLVLSVGVISFSSLSNSVDINEFLDDASKKYALENLKTMPFLDKNNKQDGDIFSNNNDINLNYNAVIMENFAYDDLAEKSDYNYSMFTASTKCPTRYYLKNFDNVELLDGRYPTSSNELVISSTCFDFIKENFDYKDNFSKITISKNEVVGIYKSRIDEYPEIYQNPSKALSKKEFALYMSYAPLYYLDSDVDNRSILVSFDLKDFSLNKLSGLKCLNSALFDNDETSELRNNFFFKNTLMVAISYCLMVLLVIIDLLSLVFFIKGNKKRLEIMRLLGVSRKFSILFSFSFLFLYYLTQILFGLILVPSLNYFLNSTLISNCVLSLGNFSYISFMRPNFACFIPVMILRIVSTIIIFLSYKKANSKTPYKVLVDMKREK